MHQAVPVRIGSAEFFVETVEAGADDGITPIGGALPDAVAGFDGIRDTIKAVCGELVAAWEDSGAAEATVEFGIAAEVKTGKLTGLLVGGGATASLTVTLKWTADAKS